MGSCLSTPDDSTGSRSGSKRSKNAVVPMPMPGAGPVNQQQPVQQPAGNPGSTTTNAARELTLDQLAQLASHPSFHSLVKACQALQPSNLHQHASQLATTTQSALSDLKAASRQPSSSWTAALTMVTGSVRACMDRVFAPIAQHVEHQLGKAHGADSQSSWDTIRPEQLMSLMAAGAQSQYGQRENSSPATTWLGNTMKPLAELLHHCHTQLACRQPHDVSPGVPALDALVSMTGAVLLRNVVLESQASLEARAGVVQSLVDLFSWPPAVFAACCSASSRSLLAAVQLPAEHQQGERRVKLTVRRGAAFWDALRDVQTQGLPGATGADAGRSGEVQPVHQGLACKLFPSFVDEWTAEGDEDGQVTRVVEAGEGHGPRKEFFVLAAANAAGLEISTGKQQQQEQALISTAEERATPSRRTGAVAGRAEPQPQLLVFNRTAGVFWYNTSLTQSPHLCQAYHFLGWLLGQSLLNHSPPGLALPSLMFSHLLHGISHYAPSLSDLQHLDPTLALNITKATQLPADDFKAMLELESLPTDMTREQYTQQAVRRLLVEEVTWQAEAMSAGLLTVVDPGLCSRWCVGPAELAVALGPQDGGLGGGGGTAGPLELRKVFRVVMDPDLSVGGKGQVVGDLLWEVLDSWPREKQLQFVEFVTGTQRLPLPGSELLKVECPFVAMGVVQHKALLFTLPQAHTCANLLELPDYWTCMLHVRGHAKDPLSPAQAADMRREIKHVLQDRLTVALAGCKSYGLDDRDA